MLVKSRAWAVAVTAAAALAIAVSAAGAESTIAPGGSLTAVSSGRVTFRTSSWSVACNVTLNGSFDRSTFALETSGTAIGDVDRGAFASCGGGSLSIPRLPWQLTYQSVLGSTAPMEPSGLLVRLAGVRVEALIGGVLRCQYGGDVTLLGSLASEVLLEAWDIGALSFQSGTLALLAGSPCPATGTLAGAIALEPQQALRPALAKLDPDMPDIPNIETPVASLTLRNHALASSGAPDADVETVTIDPDSADKDLFEIPEDENHCRGRALPRGGAVTCTTDVRYVGAAGERPKTTDILIRWNNGAKDVTTDVEVTATP